MYTDLVNLELEMVQMSKQRVRRRKGLISEIYYS